MKVIKLLILVLLGSLCLGSVFALEGNETGLEIWYPLDSDTNDYSINGRDGTNFGSSNTSGVFGNARSFDGSDKISRNSYNLASQTSQDYTISFWAKMSSDQNVPIHFGTRGTGAELYTYTDSGGFIANYGLDGTNNPSSTDVTNSTWYMITIKADASAGESYTYIDGILEATNTFSSQGENNCGSWPSGCGLQLGARTDSANVYYTGDIDEFTVWSRLLNDTEISNLNECNALSCFSTPTIEADVQDFYSSTNITLNLTTNPVENTNMSYILDNLSETSICNNCNTSTLELNNISEGSHSILFVSTNQDGQVNSSYNFSIDLTPPTINNTLPNEINTYNLGNISQYVTCDDTNNGTCQITFPRENLTLNTTSNYTFTYNGNQSYIINATDLAGNTITETGNILVNPIQYLYFENSLTSNIITDFTLDGKSYSSYANISTYNDIISLGINTLLFEKDGFNPKNITLNLTNSSQINNTYQIDPVTLYAKAYDIETLSSLTFDVIIQNSTSVAEFTGLTTLFKNYDEIPTGDINLRFSSTGYEDAIYYNTLTPTSSLNFSVYLTPTNSSSVITFNVKDFSTGNPLDGVLIEAQKVINGSKLTVQQTITSSSGTAYLYLDGLEDFDFILTKDDYTRAVISTIPGVTSYTVRLRQSETGYEFINDINYRFTPDRSILTRNISYDLGAFISGTSLSLVEFKITSNNGSVLFSDTSSNPTGTSFTFPKTFTTADNITSVLLNLTYIRNGITYTKLKKYQIEGEFTGTLESLQNFGNEESEEYKLFRLFIMLTTFAGFILVGNKFSQTRDYVSLLVIIPFIGFGFLGWLPWLYSIVLSIVAVVYFVGGNKR